jgi:polyhydroxybutyrate depolymerase
MILSPLAILLTFVLSSLASAQPLPDKPESTPPKVVKTVLAGNLTQREWTIQGARRLALLHIPPSAIPSAPDDPTPRKDTPAPVIFAFHGHGGSARQAAASFHLHKDWPDALVVYMQGLPTPSALTDPEGKRNGWQNREGQQADRDLHFFDAVLDTLKSEYRIDETRIYATGHSNGGGFAYLLWRARPDPFAAFAPSAAGGARLGPLAPKPAMHIAGRNDELVPFSLQQSNIDAVKRANACDEQGQPWADHCTLFPSKSDAPFVAYIHDGTHKFPREAPALIVKFFKEHAKPAPQAPAAPKPEKSPDTPAIKPPHGR